MNFVAKTGMIDRGADRLYKRSLRLWRRCVEWKLGGMRGLGRLDYAWPIVEVAGKAAGLTVSSLSLYLAI